MFLSIMADVFSINQCIDLQWNLCLKRFLLAANLSLDCQRLKQTYQSHLCTTVWQVWYVWSMKINNKC